MAEKENRKRRVQRQNWKPAWLVRLLYIVWRVLYSGIKVAAAAVLTVVLIVGICGFVFIGILGDYLQNEIVPLAEVNLDDYELDKTSYIYAVNADGEPEMIQQIFSTTDRQWVAYADLPEELIRATVALEDKRFYEHQGVDWITTVKAGLNLFMGGGWQFGGSTITQQLIKNLFLTEDEKADDVTIQRKLLEIFRALEFEKRYDKDVVLEYYLNVIYFGRGCYGVKSAAATYFGKELQDLTVAEYASLISITNNPFRYDPYRSEATSYYKPGPEENRVRQEYCLEEMRNQNWITQEEFDAALAQELVFKDGIDTQDKWVNCPNEECTHYGPVRELTRVEETYSCPLCGTVINVKEGSTQSVYSYFVDTVLLDVAAYLAQQDGLVWDQLSKSVRENYMLLIQRRGYHIYTTLNLDVQEKLDTIYQDLEQIPETKSGQQLQSAMVIIDNDTGDVAAIAGGVGEKTDFLGLNRATQSKLQVGSSMKPLGVYAPAFELGVITPATVINDMPLYYKEDGTPYPRNDTRVYDYSRTILQGIVRSLNGISIGVLDTIGTQYSFNFAKNKFKLSTLTDRYETSSGQILSDIGYSSLGMGALTVGVTVRDMAEAYATFANNGVWRESRTFTKVYDSDGNLVIDNQQYSEQILSEKTVTYVNYCLDLAVQGGTGTLADFKGMNISGKTGTTSNNKDRYFCGYTPYYTGAVWSGYDQPEKIVTVSGIKNPSTVLWKKVMEPVHKGLENKELFSYDNMVEVTVCLDSGKLATPACSHDIRNSDRLQTAYVYPEDLPTQFCDAHVSVDYCTVGGGVANEYCHKFEDVGAIVLNKTSLVKRTEAQVKELFAAMDSGLKDMYLRNDYIYLINSRGEDMPFYGIAGNVANPAGTPYLSCQHHNRASWNQYVAEHPWIDGGTTEPTRPTDPSQPADPTTPSQPDDEDEGGNWWDWIFG